MAANSKEWVALAVVTQPHGVRGQVKVKSFTDPAKGFASYALTDAKGTPIKLKISGNVQDMFIATIDGLSDRNEAEHWRGRELGVPRSALKPVARDDAFYIADLEGMEVFSTEGKKMGHVASVANYGAGDLLEIADLTGRTEYYTFTDKNFPAVDMAARRITFTPPELLGSREEEGAE